MTGLRLATDAAFWSLSLPPVREWKSQFPAAGRSNGNASPGHEVCHRCPAPSSVEAETSFIGMV